MVDKGNKGDPRKNYILRIASHLFALNVNENKLQNLNAIQKFCDTNASLLIVEKNETVSFFIFKFSIVKFSDFLCSLI